MTRRRRWMWGGLFMVPVIGAGLAFALPPMDEYAALDGVGTRVGAESSEWVGRMRLLGDSERRSRDFAIRVNGPALASLGSSPSTVRAVTPNLYERGGDVRLRIWRVDSGEAKRRLLDRFFSPQRGWSPFYGGSLEYYGGPVPYAINRIRLNDETGDCLSLLEGPGETLLCVEEPEESTRFGAKLRRWFRLAFSR